MVSLRALALATLAACASAYVAAPSPARLALGAGAARAAPLPTRPTLAMRTRICDLTGKSRNQKRVVTFSHIRNRKVQNVNLQEKRFWWPEGYRFVKMRVSTKAIKTIAKYGIEKASKKYDVDLANY